MKSHLPKVLGRAATLLLLTACHAPAQTQATQTQAAQTQTTQAQAKQITLPRTSTAPALPRTDAQSKLPWISLTGLPPQGQQTYKLIVRGGPFPYARDGVAYQNREDVLPRRSRGTYHEYTVKTPGSSDRGARRIVCAAVPECYYTADHYASFSRIRP